jgi:hypothetical protein
MLVVSIMDIRDSLEAFCQTSANLILASVLIATWFGASGHIENAIIGEIAHDGIKIVAIEGFQEALQ